MLTIMLLNKPANQSVFLSGYFLSAGGMPDDSGPDAGSVKIENP
ncbi:MAG: hypothetical protein VB085_13190 [Peptococcaceae bacterium]|nr:hypothetical protein [Peptococcaceae bacterium]